MAYKSDIESSQENEGGQAQQQPQQVQGQQPANIEPSDPNSDQLSQVSDVESLGMDIVYDLDNVNFSLFLASDSDGEFAGRSPSHPSLSRNNSQSSISGSLRHVAVSTVTEYFSLSDDALEQPMSN
ncbi:unnamed protein product [Notodromas monacha]|uniref:Uncharacterized protein n=1 Tax=Notodromas monacha TaxID=399045 RepID=A0A7R9GG12_9CRUS|nr:unnamed protein product [Notodromas monacha]CAG0919702.1 unnamed protein product [Notodromas monacha]